MAHPLLPPWPADVSPVPGPCSPCGQGLARPRLPLGHWLACVSPGSAVSVSSELLGQLRPLHRVHLEFFLSPKYERPPASL